MALPNPYNTNINYYSPTQQQTQTATSSKVTSPSSGGNMWDGILRTVNNIGSTIGMGVNTIFPGSVPKWNPRTPPVLPLTTNTPVDLTNLMRQQQPNYTPSSTTTASATPQTATPQNTQMPSYQAPTTTNQANTIKSMASNDGTTYGTIVNSLANLRGNNPDVQAAYNSVYNLEAGLGAGNNAIMAKPIPLEFQQGQMAALQRDYGPQLTAARGILESALAGQGRELQGLQSAGQFAQPIQVPYANQIVNPLTGQPIQGGSTTGGLPASIPDLATAVLQGKMNWVDAQNQLGGIPTLTNQLRTAIQQQNPNFNFNLSAASAQTQAQGQQIQTTATAAMSALDKLVTDFSNLPGVQTGGIPATNSIANWIATQFGQSALSSYTTTLHDARAQLEGVLTATGATTPSGAEAMALAYLPDNMTPSQLASKVEAAKTLIQQKVSAFVQSGQQTGYTGQNSLWSW